LPNITISNAACEPLHIFTLSIYHKMDGYACHGGASIDLAEFLLDADLLQQCILLGQLKKNPRITSEYVSRTSICSN